MQFPIKVCTAHIHYNPNKTVSPIGSIIETRPFSYLHSVRHQQVQYLFVRNHLFIATVYSAAYWYVYCRSILHIGVCHSYCSFPVVIKIWKWSFFFTFFFTITHVIEYFGIIRKANITSNVLKIIIMIIIIMKHSLKEKKKGLACLSFFSFHLIYQKFFINPRLLLLFIRKLFVNYSPGQQHLHQDKILI